MGDIFIENLVKKRFTGKEIALSVLIALVALALAAFFFWLAFTGFFSGFMFLFAVGALYGGYKLITLFDIEFETSFTNGSFDVDKIINRRKRKRLITVNCKDVIEIGKYNAEALKNKDCQTKIIACDSELSDDVWYLITNHSSLGRSLVVFNMTDKLKDSFKTFIPRQISFSVFGI